jgi:hypothetical protein
LIRLCTNEAIRTGRQESSNTQKTTRLVCTIEDNRQRGKGGKTEKNDAGKAQEVRKTWKVKKARGHENVARKIGERYVA